MASLRPFVRSVAKLATRSIAGLELERHGRTIALVNAGVVRDAWFSYGSLLGAILRDFGVTRVLDVGANTGQFATMLRRYFRGPIHSFEPVSEVFGELARRAGGDPNWHVHPIALGASRAQRDIHISKLTDFSSLRTPNRYLSE